MRLWKNVFYGAIILGIQIFASGVLIADEVFQKWVTRYNGSANHNDYARAIAIDNIGNVYVTGDSYNNGANYDYATIKYDNDGNQVWVAYYNGTANNDDFVKAIVADNSGNIYITGAATNNDTGKDYLTIKYDVYGNEEWVACYNGISNDEAYGLALDSLGNIYVTGKSFRDGRYDCLTIKYDSSGNEKWIASYYNNDPNHSYCGNGIAIDRLGNVYVNGNDSGGGLFTIKYEPNGYKCWASHYNGEQSYSLSSGIVTDNFGNIYITGYTSNIGTTNDYTTIKYDPNGNQKWIKFYNGPGNGSDVACGIALDSKDNVYVTGYSYGIDSSTDFATVKYDSDGHQKWVAIYNGNTYDYFDYASAIALDNLDNVYVTGRSLTATGFDYATIKYDPNGNQKWNTYYNGPINNNDNACDITVDKSGSIYVTGSSANGSNHDYATIKYMQHLYCIAPIIGDFNDDCKVNFKDFAAFAMNWLQCNYAVEEDCW